MNRSEPISGPTSAVLALVFPGSSELAALCRAKDWAATPLGSPDRWPASLRTAAGIVVAASFPMMLAWGPELIQIYNDPYRDIMGDKHPEGLGRSVASCWSEVWDRIRPLFERVRVGETIRLDDLPLMVARRGAAEEAFFTFSYSPVRDEAGGVGGVLDTVFETTGQVAARQFEGERERISHELELERRRLASVFAQAPVMLAVLRGPEHRIESANAAYHQLVGTRDIVGRPFVEALPEMRGQELVELLDQVLATGTPAVGREVPVRIARAPGGRHEEHFVDFAYLPLVEADASRTGIMVHGTDVTDHVHARARIEQLLRESEVARTEAEEANRAKSQFLANMSHEIRTPINAVLGYADLLEVGLGGSLSEGQLTYVGRIKSSGRHLTGLVDEILDLAKIEAGGLEIGRTAVPAGETIRAALEMVLPQAESKGVGLPDAPAFAPHVVYLGDPDRVRQILVNLLSNAVKFTAPGGRVTPRCRLSATGPGGGEAGSGETWVVIEVEDSGRGIAAGELSRIFEPFVQVDGSHAREQGGTGLGLTISRRLARLMEGDLTVASEPGKGSCFTLWLPAAGATAAAVASTEWSSGWPSAPGEVPHLAATGHMLMENADAVVGRLADRIAVDAEIPHAHALDRAQLEDHTAAFLSAIGKALVVLDEGGGEPALMRDGTEIQRLIADLHGEQRARLGWTAEELRREFAILREEVDGLVVREVSATPDRGAASRILHRLLERAERISHHRLTAGTRADGGRD